MRRVKGARRKVGRKKLTPEEKKARAALALQRRKEAKFRLTAKNIFIQSGFEHIKSADKEFTFETGDGSRTTELDGVFVFENLIVVVEDTCLANPSGHLAQKLIGFDLFLAHSQQFVELLIAKMPDFKSYFERHDYRLDHYLVRIMYFSMHPLGADHVSNAVNHHVCVASRSLTNYFAALVGAISRSAKYEILKFLGVDYADIGDAKMAGGSAKPVHAYQGLLLPEGNSSYPPGFKIVSFYADPNSLLKKAYVLRKNSWRTPSLSYQRILDKSKIRAMRRYLRDKKRVYPGNIVAALPATALDDAFSQNQLSPSDLQTVKPVSISLPDTFNVVGLIDGQHRVFSYHESADEFEPEISKLRRQQNLLVTAVIFPEGISEQERIQFEANLFLEINTQQTSVYSGLTHEIELIVNPTSAIAVAKAVLVSLSRTGALREKLEEDIFDDTPKLKVTSIVSYGLRPLTKKEGPDSLFTAFKAVKGLNVSEITDSDLGSFVEFCTVEINSLLNAVKKSYPEGWVIGHESKLLTPTSVNGFLRCLRLILENGNERGLDAYESRLQGIRDFKFSDYKSSHWSRLGNELYSQFFG